ncbi:phospholipase D family protein [Candidatus Binatus sp.]|uniref:phospholipase D family protein n=1 Tax=Candidatus Binatus sp. TaxID=2811406 RepID=UPI003BBABCEB
MDFRLVDHHWGKELETAARSDAKTLRIICPFIKVGALKRFLGRRRFEVLQVITRFNQIDFASGVSDIEALRILLKEGATVRGVRNLHAKLYLFGSDRAIVASTNLTQAAFDRNHELGFVSDEASIITECTTYFEKLWARAGTNLSSSKVEDWDKTVTRHLALSAGLHRSTGLRDYGADAGIPEAPPESPPISSLLTDAPQAFVKFLGESSNRVPLSFQTIQEIREGGCGTVLAYPASKRPNSVEDGAIMFISRLTRDRDDIRVFGLAIGMRHVPGRDDATPADIKRRSWRKTWPHYIRVHHAQFVAGTMENGVSLYKLMDSLGSDSFEPTQRNAARGEGNTNPRRAYSQQAAVKLSPQGLTWLSTRLEAAFRKHGTVPSADLAKVD